MLCVVLRKRYVFADELNELTKTFNLSKPWANILSHEYLCGLVDNDSITCID